MQDSVSSLLLDWYDEHARVLPWRVLPNAERLDAAQRVEIDPYRVWLSEVMLQQTTVAAVKPYFAKFTEKWPDVMALAAASDEEIMAAWAGLGYYSRARNLVKCARAIAEMDGEFPSEEADLLKLPGLGAYTAAAIAAIAFGKRAVVVDANVERVVARLNVIDEPLPAGRKALRSATDKITPEERSGDFAQAMMDLGSSLCTARDAKCLLCPLTDLCKARASGEPLKYPVKAKKKPKPVRTGTAYWIESDGAVWLVKRPDKGMLGGMRALPDDGWAARQDGDEIAPLKGEWRDAGLVRHTFTHFHIELGLAVYSGNEQPKDNGKWWPIDQLEEAGLPTLFSKVARLVLAAR